MNQEDRWDILDQLPGVFKIVEDDEDLDKVPGTLQSWGSALEHSLDDRRICRTCGRGQACPFIAFYDAVVSSVVRELDRMGRLSRVGVTVIPKDTRGPVTWCEHGPERHGPEAGCVECQCIWAWGHNVSPSERLARQNMERLASVVTRREEDERLNDPWGMWGSSPSYRCYVSRHKACEPEGADQGCTCACGHQEPVCVCNSREVDQDGNLVHALGCPSAPVRSAFERDHEEDMADPEYREAFEQTSEELRAMQQHEQRNQE